MRRSGRWSTCSPKITLVYSKRNSYLVFLLAKHSMLYIWGHPRGWTILVSGNHSIAVKWVRYRRAWGREGAHNLSRKWELRTTTCLSKHHVLANFTKRKGIEGRRSRCVHNTKPWLRFGGSLPTSCLITLTSHIVLINEMWAKQVR